MKKILLTLLGVLIGLPIYAETVNYTYEGQTLKYYLHESERSASVSGLDNEGDLIIPEKVFFEGVEYTVTYIVSNAFENCRGLTSVEIPNSVTGIGELAFYKCSGLKSVIICNSVRSIGDKAFYECNGLIKSAYPNTISNPFRSGLAVAYNPEGSIIEDGWIYGPEKKEILFAPLNLEGELIIPETVSSIGEDSFYGCSGLTSVTIPNSVTEIGNSAFYGCSGLTSVTIPNSVTEIGNNAFYGCSGLTLVIIGNSVTSIGEKAFYECNGLIKSAYPNTISSPFWHGFSVAYNPKGAIIEDGWIYGLEKKEIRFAPYNLEGEFIIPEIVTSIGQSAFRGCSGLTSVTIPNSVTSIGGRAFYECDNLESVNVNWITPVGISSDTFSESVYSNAVLNVPENTFTAYAPTGWGVFKNLVVDGCNPGTATDGVFTYKILENQDKGEAILIAGDYKSLTEAAIPERFTDESDPANPKRYYVTGIGPNAFQDCANLEAVSFNSRSQITGIGPNAFSGCSKLASITMPSMLREIGYSAFYNCTSLNEVVLNDQLESIGSFAFAFSKNDNMQRGSLTVPASLKSIGENAFLNRLMDKVIISDLKAWCDIDFSNNDSNPCGWAEGGFWLSENEIVDLVIPDGVTEVKPYSFVTTGKLKSVVIPAGVKSIGDEAFFWNQFSSVTIPASVDYIGFRAFSGWDYYYSSSWGMWLFSTYLKKLILEDSLNPIEIDEDAFTVPTEISSAYNWSTCYNTPGSLYLGRPLMNSFNGLKIHLYSLVIGNTIETVPESMFADTGLSTLKLGSSLKEIGANAFSNCKSLGEVVIPPSVETIGASAFAGAANLESIIMGHSVKTIGEKAFDGCPASTISITAQTPPSAPNNTFSNYTGNLYLQGQAAVDAYYDAYTCWDRFSSYVMIEPTEMKYEGLKSYNVKLGDKIQLTATLMPDNVTLPQVFWRSTNPEIATVDENGLVTIVGDISDILTRAEGCKIIAESLYADGPVAEISIFTENSEVEAEGITLNKTKAEVEEGESLTLTATVTPEEATDKTVIWSSSDENVATVDQAGVVTGVSAGVAVITAKTANGKEATCQITVTEKVIEVSGITLNGDQTISEGESVQLTPVITPADATNRDVTWSSSDENVATVDQNGKVTGVSAGVAVITARTSNGKEATCQITVTAKKIEVSAISLDKTEETIKEEETLQLTATVTPADATDQTVTWSSSDETVATVDQDGLVTALKAGKATITARTANGKEAKCELTVETKTGIDGVEADAQISVAARDGVIIVTAPDEADVEVYSMTGLCVAKTREHRIDGLAGGVYIVRVGGKTFKVMVK